MSKTNGVSLILRAEAMAVLVAALTGYGWSAGSWAMLALLFLLPDLSMVGYVWGKRAGAGLYNVAHSYLTPALLAAISWLLTGAPPAPAWLIWFAHIAFDRMLGYGLKHADGFGNTHLGRIGATSARLGQERRPGGDKSSRNLPCPQN